MLNGHHDPVLVALSIVLAVSTSYTALDLSARVRRARGRARFGWTLAAAIVLGSGVWSMHFVAMLAFKVGIALSYDAATTVLSLLLALAVSGVALGLADSYRARPEIRLACGALLGLGVVGMHYTGMRAVQIDAVASYHPTGVIFSILLAVLAGTAAMWLVNREGLRYRRALAGIVLGLGVAGTHYAAMAALTLTAAPGVHEMVTEPVTRFDRTELAIAVAAMTFIILFVATVAVMYDRRFAVLAAREASALRASEERYRNLYRRTPLPLHSLDAAGRIEQVSDSWLTLLGYRRDEVVGRSLTDFMTRESARMRDEVHWPKLMATGELTDAEYRLVTRDGTVLDCMLSATVERDAAGRVVKSHCGLIDVTARRRAEEALRQAQKLEAVGQLTGGIAHDFNNLLAVILGNLELARKRANEDSRLLRMLDNTIQAAQRGVALTQRMLAFARRQDLKPEPVNVPDLVLGMADLLRRSIGPTVRIETRFPLGLPRANVDANQLELALLNLAVNARDAMPDGGTIIIEAREEQVPATGVGPQDGNDLAPGDYFCLRVRDTGSGMDEETLARATEPFFTTKGVGKGTGLGLAMVHGLAAQSGGRLVLASRRGEGTMADIWLPIAAAPPAAAASTEPEMPPQVGEPGRLGVLVVDDDPLVLGATAAMLEDIGFAVIEASSGRQALDILESKRDFDVVLTDQAMPGMTGVQLIAAIRARWPHLAVVLGTGYAELPEGADPDLIRLGKPFGRDALERAVRTACQRRRRGMTNVVNLPPRLGSG